MTRPRKKGARIRLLAGARRRTRGPRPGKRAQLRPAILGLILLAIAGLGIWAVAGPGPAAREGQATTVVLKPGSGLTGIAGELKSAQVIRSALLFMMVSKLTGAGRTLKAGEYAIPSHASLNHILRMLRSGEVVRHLVTLPEGLTSAQAVAVLAANPALTGQAETPPEGSLLPETYEVDRGTPREQVLERMHAAQEKLMARLWPQRRSGLPFSTPQQALILASIVEKETGLPEERPRVAAVFVNRLARGMPLGSDPTVVYGISKGVPLGHGLKQSELAEPTPYNTYRFAGLPPTPICNPGRAAIAAVLNPPRTGELYFVANGSGGHSFSSTIEEHEKNVARWRQLEKERQTSGGPVAGGSGAEPGLRETQVHAR